MNTIQRNYRNIQSLQNPARQRGFFSVGIGLGLTALYGIIAGVVVAKNGPDETYNQVSEQQVESQVQVSSYKPPYSESGSFLVSTYD